MRLDSSSSTGLPVAQSVRLVKLHCVGIRITQHQLRTIWSHLWASPNEPQKNSLPFRNSLHIQDASDQAARCQFFRQTRKVENVWSGTDQMSDKPISDSWVFRTFDQCLISPDQNQVRLWTDRLGLFVWDHSLVMRGGETWQLKLLFTMQWDIFSCLRLNS